MWFIQLLISIMLFVGVAALLFIYGLIIYFIITVKEEMEDKND